MHINNIYKLNHILSIVLQHYQCHTRHPLSKQTFYGGPGAYHHVTVRMWYFIYQSNIIKHCVLFLMITAPFLLFYSLHTMLAICAVHIHSNMHKGSCTTGLGPFPRQAWCLWQHNSFILCIFLYLYVNITCTWLKRQVCNESLSMA